MTTTILLVRHAAHGHLAKRLSGRMPGIPLSDEGRAQAARLGAALAVDRVDRVECSPLDRTRETAAAITAACGLPAAVDVDALVELDMGDWTGASFDALHGDPAWNHWNAERGTARIPGGESMGEAQMRIAGHLVATAAARPGETVAMVTHSDMIRAGVAHVLGLSLDDMLRFEVDPASITRIVAGTWGAKLQSLNERVA